MNPRISRSTVLAAGAIASLLAATPAQAQRAHGDERAVVATVTKFLDGIRTRDTSLMRSTVVSGAALVSVGDTGLDAPTAIAGIIEHVGKGTGAGNDERSGTPKVQIDAQLASLQAYYTVTRPGETKIAGCGHHVFLLRKAPDGWKIFHIAATGRTEGCKAIP